MRGCGQNCVEYWSVEAIIFKLKCDRSLILLTQSLI